VASLTSQASQHLPPNSSVSSSGASSYHQHRIINMKKGPSGKGDIGVGFSDGALLIVSMLGFAMLAVSLYSIFLIRLKSAKYLEGNENEGEEIDYDERLDKADVSTLNRAQRRARAKNRMKKQRRITPTGADAAAPPEGEIHNTIRNGRENQAIQDANEDADADANKLNMSRKERQKAAKSIEREERRLFEEKRREIQQDSERRQLVEKKERERREVVNKEEERCLREREQQERKQVEHTEWKTFIRNEEREHEISVREFVSEVKSQKVVRVGDIAERYRVSPQQISARIKELQDSNRINGVLDEHGRFVYIGPNEMKAVADIVRQKGRISLADLAIEIAELVGAVEATTR